MKAVKPFFFVILFMVVMLGLQQSLFIVNQTQQALVIQLGHPLDKVYGPVCTSSFPSCRRWCTSRPAFWIMTPVRAEALTSDLKSIVLDNYARWKIVDPLRFYRTMRTEHNAQGPVSTRSSIHRYARTSAVTRSRRSWPTNARPSWSR